VDEVTQLNSLPFTAGKQIQQLYTQLKGEEPANVNIFHLVKINLNTF